MRSSRGKTAGGMRKTTGGMLEMADKMLKTIGGMLEDGQWVAGIRLVSRRMINGLGQSLINVNGFMFKCSLRMLHLCAA